MEAVIAMAVDDDCTGGKIDGEILTDLRYVDNIAILSETVPHLTDITRWRHSDILEAGNVH